MGLTVVDGVLGVLDPPAVRCAGQTSQDVTLRGALLAVPDSGVVGTRRGDVGMEDQVGGAVGVAMVVGTLGGVRVALPTCVHPVVVEIGAPVLAVLAVIRANPVGTVLVRAGHGNTCLLASNVCR